MSHNGVWTVEDRLASPVQEVAFEVPRGVCALTVRLSYDRGAGVLDLGCQGPDGFRGWSGGARSEYTIGPRWATPGYRPGPIEPGTWRVLLGLYRIPLNGLAYELSVVRHRRALAVPRGRAWRTVRVPAMPPRPAAAVRRDLPDLGGLRWSAGDTHAHTHHSDGTLSVLELASAAAERGLDFLVVTDHNTISHHSELPAAGALADIVLIPGQEVTTDLGHANVFGDIGWIDFREPAAEWVKTARDRGGLLSINHPVADDCAWRHPLTDRPRLAEVWHSSWWDRTRGAPLAWAQAWREDVIVIGGGDFHKPEEGHPPGAPTTWVLGQGAEGVLAGLEAGRTAVSVSPDGPLLLRHGEEFLVRDAAGLLLWGPDIRVTVKGDRMSLPARPGIHRLETTRNEVMALCT